jgi:hypothetical protein
MVIVKAHSLESRYRHGKTPTERITALDAKYSNANGKMKILTCVAAAFEAASSGSSETSMACLSA